MLELASLKATSRVAKLEWPEEITCLLEIGSDSDNLVDQILHADDAIFAKVVFDQLIVCKRNALLIDLAISAFVDELAHGLERWVTVGNPRLHNFEHFPGCLCETHKYAIVDLEQTKELENFARLRRDLVDTTGYF